MVCNMVAVVSARLETRFGVELLASEPGLRALAEQLAPLLGGVPEVILQTLNGVPTALLRSPQLTVILTQDGVSAQSYRLSRPQIEAVLAKTREVGELLAVPLAQERLVNAVKATYGQLSVLSDTRQGAARVTRIRLPL